MLTSMTAFARKSHQGAFGQMVWELRSVNHRYLDLSLKMPEIFREWEMELREVAQTFLNRGKVECILNFTPGESVAPHLQVNHGLANQLIAASQDISKLINFSSEKSALRPIDLLRWPGMILSQSMDSSELKAPLMDSFKSALAELQMVRQREGQELAAFLKQHLIKALNHYEQIKTEFPSLIQIKRDKLQEKLSLLQQEFDKTRLEQEMVIFAQRIDIMEELERFIAHLEEVKRCLVREEAVGRRLDFLMQEMQREVNTLGAKALSSIISHEVVELKVLIEQMREQIQNVE